MISSSVKPALVRLAVHVGGIPVNLWKAVNKKSNKENAGYVPFVDMYVVLNGA